MRLLDTETGLFIEVADSTSVRYAILSHTWGDEEMTFDEFQAIDRPEKKGFAKIRHTCRQAVLDGYKYSWVDTVSLP